MPKMFGEVLLDLKAEGTKLTGRVASWGGPTFSSNYPHLTFTGTVDGDQMTLSMDGEYKMELKGERMRGPR